MSENIYQTLGFKATERFIFERKLIDQAKKLFNDIPLRNITARQLMIKETIYAETLAISTTEDSDLTEKEAKKITLSPEMEARLIKYKDNDQLTDKEKYRQLEYENILSTEINIRPMGFDEINLDFLMELHYNLTIGLDNYCKSAGHSKYHSGKFRKDDHTKVGKIRPYIPPKASQIKSLLQKLINEFKKRKEIDLVDIFEFTVLLYAIHPFSNGNKRTVTLIESMLIQHYGYGVDGMLSMSLFYQMDQDGFHFFLLTTLRKKRLDYFINFALRGYLRSGKIMILKAIEYYEKMLPKMVEKQIPEKYKKRYLDAFKCMFKLGLNFNQSELIELMKKQGYSAMMTRQVLQHLKEKNMIQKQKKVYYLGRDGEILEFARKVDEFFIENGIVFEERL